MTRLIAFGEALVDMLSSRLGTSSAQETFTPYAGGAPANVAVACARLGVPSLFVGMLGRDRFGDFILAELASHGVDVSHVMRTDEAKTALPSSRGMPPGSAASTSTGPPRRTCSTGPSTCPRICSAWMPTCAPICGRAGR
jgi:hypothetical protein